jgi:hypothetical protein
MESAAPKGIRLIVSVRFMAVRGLEGRINRFIAKVAKELRKERHGPFAFSLATFAMKGVDRDPFAVPLATFAMKGVDLRPAPARKAS